MLYRLFFHALIVSAFCALSVPDAHASCGEGYLERLDRRGEPFCLSEAQVRKQLLATEQIMRQKKREWRATLIRDQQKMASRQFAIEQRRRNRVLN